MSRDAAIVAVPVSRVGPHGALASDTDGLAIEEPLEIRLGLIEEGTAIHRSISITMRTPGDDFELAAGFLFSEGIIHDAGQIEGIRHCGVPAPHGTLRNTVRVDLRSDVVIDFKRLERHFYTSSSCGVCGKTSIAALQTGVAALPSSNSPLVSAHVVHRLPNTLRASQTVFDRTGGLHAAALFDSRGAMACVREDVGRHNALDKLIGVQFLAGLTPLSRSVLMVSGRASFELVQKALMAGIPILAAVGAPSSLAVELAREYGMTLLGFVRDTRFNIYTGAERIDGRCGDDATAR